MTPLIALETLADLIAADWTNGNLTDAIARLQNPEIPRECVPALTLLACNYLAPDDRKHLIARLHSDALCLIDPEIVEA